MTLQEMKALLEATGYPVAYRQFKTSKNSTPPSVPFIVYFISGSSGRGSDFKNLLKEKTVRVELYTDKKDPAAESKVEQALNFTEYQNDESYIDSEQLYMNGYEFTLYEKI